MSVFNACLVLFAIFVKQSKTQRKMKEVESIKELLLSSDSYVLGIELTKSQGLTEDVLKSIRNDINTMIKKSEGFEKFPPETIIEKFDINYIKEKMTHEVIVVGSNISIITQFGYHEIESDPDIEEQIDLFFDLKRDFN